MISEAEILGASVLIVDDKPANISLLERTLIIAGYTRVTSTMKPKEVLELHRANHYDLILLDLQMPGMDGFQIMEGLKLLEQDSFLSVIVVTAQPDLKIRALRAGARDFVSKPFDLAEVLMRVHNLVEMRLLHRAARRHAEALESLALRDHLTGLPNRRLFDERMTIALAHARMFKSAMAVVYLDLDGFKGINDSLGHDVGDLLLKMVATRLVASLREEDTVARVGGDEFILTLWHVQGKEDAALVTSRAIAALSQPYEINGSTVKVTASAGVAVFPANGEEAATLIKSADLALYDAKHAGKNVCRVSERVEKPATPATPPLNDGRRRAP